MSTKTLVETYYRCWLDSDREGARNLLADDLVFRSPRDNFDSADAFMSACWSHAEGFNRMDVRHGVYDADGAYLVYESDGFACGELLRIADGKINAIYVTFDPTH